MSKKRTVHRVSDTKRSKPFIRFNFWVMVIIFGISFMICFVLYMIAVNLDNSLLNFATESSSVSESDFIPDDNSHIDNSESVPDISTPDSSALIINPVPESERADDSYFDKAWILTDSSLLNIKFNTSIQNVLGNENINAVNINEGKVESVYGTITAYQNVQIINPEALYIMLGSDIGESSVDDMINSYDTFIANLTATLPHTKIYIMQLPPVYTDSETLSNEKINDYNSRLIQLADTHSVYCIDTNTILKNNTGTLEENYYSTDEDSLSSKAYSVIYEYILTHIAK